VIDRRPDTDNYRALFLTHTPLIDTRAPVEFSQGSFPSALNLPLMDDDERAQVGLCYKRSGQQAAIELGQSLVSGEKKDARIARWQAFTRRFETGYLFCFRGGLRSQTVQQWLRDAGTDFPLVIGGYKAMRRFLLEELEHSIRRGRFVLIAGKTGTGKTRVIRKLDRAVDLEGLANHRGSSFGQLPEGQPSQIDFENRISIALLRLLASSSDAPVVLEDEGRLIGRLSLPESLREKMKQSPMLIVEQNLEERVEVVVEDYILDLGRRYRRRFGDDGAHMHRDKLLADLSRIRKRLGGLRFAQVSQMIGSAFDLQWSHRDLRGHREWIALLLEGYYDPMYEYQLQQRVGRRIFSGSRDEVIAEASATANKRIAARASFK